MYRLTFFLLLLILSLSSCKKDKNDKEEEKLPVFGNCKPVTPAGHISQASTSGPYTFRTNGGGIIIVDPDKGITIRHDSYTGFSLEFWGDIDMPGGGIKTSANHENLNGKHIKDRKATRRTIIFPDGAKITFVSNGDRGTLLSVSIYDGEEAHYINPTCNSLEYSSINASISKQLDNLEPDGETSAFEFTPGGLLYFNQYNEESAGNKVVDYYKLGEIYHDQPKAVNDYYDDPRLGHT